MRCPQCGRFCKEVKVYVDDRELNIYSDCAFCGRTLMDKTQEEGGSEEQKKTDVIKVLFIILFVISAGLSGVLYYVINQDRLTIADYSMRYQDLNDRYLTLVNTTNSIEKYYEEISDMYTALRSEYSNLEESYTALMREKVVLQNEIHVLEDIVNLKKSIIVVSNKTLELVPEQNVTLTYISSYAGCIMVNFTSSSDIFFWVGSSMAESEYYARYPPFPETATEGMFKTPVCGTIYINVINPSEMHGAIIVLSIKYVY